ncbi:MAG: hypothetical protein GY851_09430 [bacterium]|nr:hypothetical protein [bacterium]
MRIRITQCKNCIWFCDDDGTCREDSPGYEGLNDWPEVTNDGWCRQFAPVAELSIDIDVGGIGC